ncbi:MAG: DUF3007 family protein [Pseudanabaena sp. ELA607]|jgi:apolipoprotein N-acyltransferase
MRRIDAILITFGLFATGGLLFWIFRASGINEIDAGVWSQAVFLLLILGWLLTYAVRAVTQNMTYNRQLAEYKTAVLKKQWESLSEEEQAKILAELDQEP